MVREGLNSAAGNTKLTSKYISTDRKAAVLTRMFTITSIKSAAQVELLRTWLISVRLVIRKLVGRRDTRNVLKLYCFMTSVCSFLFHVYKCLGSVKGGFQSARLWGRYFGRRVENG